MKRRFRRLRGADGCRPASNPWHPVARAVETPIRVKPAHRQCDLTVGLRCRRFENHSYGQFGVRRHLGTDQHLPCRFAFRLRHICVERLRSQSKAKGCSIEKNLQHQTLLYYHSFQIRNEQKYSRFSPHPNRLIQRRWTHENSLANWQLLFK